MSINLVIGVSFQVCCLLLPVPSSYGPTIYMHLWMNNSQCCSLSTWPSKGHWAGLPYAILQQYSSWKFLPFRRSLSQIPIPDACMFSLNPHPYFILLIDFSTIGFSVQFLCSWTSTPPPGLRFLLYFTVPALRREVWWICAVHLSLQEEEFPCL